MCVTVIEELFIIGNTVSARSLNRLLIVHCLRAVSSWLCDRITIIVYSFSCDFVLKCGPKVFNKFPVFPKFGVVLLM